MTDLLRRPATWLTTAAALLFIAFLYCVVPNYRIYEIHTGSMTPTIPTGSLVIDHLTHDPHIGQVITFHRPGDGAIVTHRVVGITADGEFITKGDANPTPDLGSTPANKVVGQVMAAPKHLGAWIHFLSHDVLGFVFDGLILLIMCLALAKPARKGGHRRRASESAVAASELLSRHAAANPRPVDADNDLRRIGDNLPTADTEIMTPADVFALRQMLNA